MAEKSKLLDVWIVEAKTVYREVPFAVVSDWLQQGRLLGEDRVRPAGGKAWFELSKVPAFAPYMPKPVGLSARDQAEALEPIDLGFEAVKHVEGEDEDVDMIPLIDISLVLLIFFMMTATVSSAILSPIPTPPARHKNDTISEGMYWIGIDIQTAGGLRQTGPDGKPLPLFSMGKDRVELSKASADAKEAINALGNELLTYNGDEARVRLRAHQDLNVETIKDVTKQLKLLENRVNAERPRQNLPKLSVTILGEVSEPQTK